jgi:hypothetical protein
MSTHLVWEYPSIAAGDIYLPQYITPTYLSTIPLLSYSSNLPAACPIVGPAPSWGLPHRGVCPIVGPVISWDLFRNGACPVARSVSRGSRLEKTCALSPKRAWRLLRLAGPC